MKIKPEDIAQLSNSKDWKNKHTGQLYLSPGSRININIEKNGTYEYMSQVSQAKENDDDQDPQTQSDEFAKGFMEQVGNELTPRQLMSLIDAMSEQLMDNEKGVERLKKVIDVLKVKVD